MTRKIRIASLEDVGILAPLFDGYTQFYRQPSDIESCRKFLSDRLEKDEAIILLAFHNDLPAGFTLLYPSFSSVSRAPILILNDLFVHPDYRRKSVGKSLLDAAVLLGKKRGAVRLHLETEITNISAQALYEQEGWIKESGTYHYNYTL